MLNHIYLRPLFWISIYAIGYATTIIVFGIQSTLTKIESIIPKLVIRVFALLTFIAPIIILPFTRGPKIPIPTPISLILGIIILVIVVITRVLGQREIGTSPALKNKKELITTGIYRVIRNPLYTSNGLLAVAFAVIFKSLYGFLFSIVYFFLWLPLIYLEEKDLKLKYGKEYEEYMAKTPWRMIPKIF